jgi:hypothetical protein
MKTSLIKLSKELITPLILIAGIVFLPLTTSAATLSSGMNAAYVIGAGSATQDFTADTSGTTASTLNTPRGVDYDSVNNRLFVAEDGNSRVLVFNTDSNGVPLDYTADYVLGQADFTSHVNTTTQSGMDRPTNVEYDEDRSLLFVADEDGTSDLGGGPRILVFDLSGGITNGMNASYVFLQPDFVTALASTTQSTANGVKGMSLDETNDRLYLRTTYRVLMFDVRDNTSDPITVCGTLSSGIVNGMNASCVLGQANFTAEIATTTQSGLGAAENESFGGIFIEETNERLFVSDRENSRVLVYDMSGVISNGMNASYVLGQPDFTTGTAGAVFTPTQNGFTNVGSGDAPVRDFSYDYDNNLLFASDSNSARIMVFDLSSGITNNMNASYVLGQNDFTSIGNAAALVGESQNNFYGPFRLDFVSSTEKLYVADTQAHRVMIFDLTPTVASAGGWNYVHPPLCSATFSPSTITQGESTNLSWAMSWPTVRENNYYTKVPGEGLFSSRVNSVTVEPNQSTTYRIAIFNLWGANFCEATITVLDESGEEVNPNAHLALTAGVSNSPFVKVITSFLKNIFMK